MTIMVFIGSIGPASPLGQTLPDPVAKLLRALVRTARFGHPLGPACLPEADAQPGVLDHIAHVPGETHETVEAAAGTKLTSEDRRGEPAEPARQGFDPDLGGRSDGRRRRLEAAQGLN